MVLLVVEALYVQGLIRIFPIDMVKEYTTDVVRVCVRQKMGSYFFRSESYKLNLAEIIPY